MEYMEKSERIIGDRLQTVCLDRAGEHKGEIRSILKKIEGIGLEYNPGYAPKSNARAERFIQECLRGHMFF